MPVYRYTEAGRRRLVTLAGRQSFILSGAVTAGVTLVFLFKDGRELVQEGWWLFATFGAIIATANYFSQRKRVRAVAEAVVITLDDDALIVDNGPVRLSITPAEVTSFGYIKEGIKIRGRDLSHLFILLKDLENFDDLQARLEQWVPAHIPRDRGGATFGLLIWAAMLAPLALMLAALALRIPVLNYIAAATLAAVAIWAWRSPATPPKSRPYLLLVLLPIFGLLFNS